MTAVSVDGYEALIVCPSCGTAPVLHLPHAWPGCFARCSCGAVLTVAVRWDNEAKRYVVGEVKEYQP